MELKAYLSTCRERAENDLKRFLNQSTPVAERLDESFRYSLFAGGKRIRPALAFAGCEAVGGNTDNALPAASALEMIHTYSLIHDDLPAMDDDDLRRGRPTNHKEFGDGIAILAGDALLTEAFHRMSDPAWDIPPQAKIEIIRTIADAAGANGMVGGQALDLLWENKAVTEQELQAIHINKTGRLLHAAVRAGAIAGHAEESALDQIDRYGQAIGLAFQIADDLLDVTASTKELGKTANKDQDKKKATYPSLLGLDESKKRAQTLLDDAISALEPFGERAEPLRAIAKYIVERRA